MTKKVLIVAESTYKRNLFSEMLSSHDGIDVIDAMRDGEKAIESFEKNLPDVLVLDIEIHNLNEISAFQYLIESIPIPTIILTSSKINDIESSFKPLISKASDLIIKPGGVWKEELPKIKNELINKVLYASNSNIRRINNRIRLLNKNLFIKEIQRIRAEKLSVINKHEEPRYEEYFFDKSPIKIEKLETNIIVMGASVGGPRTLETILQKIPKEFPSPILVVQHMDHFFMRQFTMRLKDKCLLEVKLGKNGELIRPGIIYIAPGDKHMQIIEKGGRPHIRVYEGEPVNFCRPSVDILFFSAATVYKNNTIGILLTGMGNDGVAGLKAIKAEGGKTIVESKETAILFGMPKVAVQLGVADFIVPNYKIRDYMMNFAKKLS
ncbi:MAG: chemotaxis-specific protein-glutamate methyltransferase CheB [Promethearchaeota archaeon]